MTTLGNAHRSRRDLIEQAVARGETLDEICASLDASSDEVDKVMRRMDTLINPPAKPRRQREPPPAPPQRAVLDDIDIDPDRPLDSYWGPADPDTVRAVLAELYPTRHRATPDAVRGLVAEGLHDFEIGLELGVTGGCVAQVRYRNGIPAAHGRGPKRRSA